MIFIFITIQLHEKGSRFEWQLKNGQVKIAGLLEDRARVLVPPHIETIGPTQSIATLQQEEGTVWPANALMEMDGTVVTSYFRIEYIAKGLSQEKDVTNM